MPKKNDEKKNMIAVDPKYAEKHPESVRKIGDYFYRPSVSAKQSRAATGAGLKAHEVHKKLFTPEGQYQIGRLTGEVPEEGRFVPGEAGKYNYTTLKDQALRGLTELERIKAEASGVFQKRRLEEFELTPPAPEEIDSYALSILGSEGGYQDFKSSGQTLPRYLMGTRYGAKTAEQIGLDSNVGYEIEKLAPWFAKLDEYRLYNEQSGMTEEGRPLGGSLEGQEYWVRGAQFGIDPETYALTGKAIRAALWTGWPKQTRGEQGETIHSEFTRPPEKILTPLEQYLFGYSDKAPEGHKPIPGGASLGYAPTVSGGEQPALDWINEKFPGVIGDKGGVQSSSGGKERIATGSSRFALRVKTLTF